MSVVLHPAFASLREQSQDGSVPAAHPAVPALSRPAWVMPTVWHSKHALSANVIHSLIKPLQKEDISSVSCCERSASTCRDAAVLAATASSLQKRQDGAVGREIASTGIILFVDEYLEVPGHQSFLVPPPAWQTVWVMGLLEKHTWCAGRNPPLLPRLFRQTYVNLKQGAHCYWDRETLTSISSSFCPCHPFTMVVTAGHRGKQKESKQTVSRSLYLYGSKEEGKNPKQTKQEENSLIKSDRNVTKIKNK